MDMTKRYSFVKGEERIKLVPRYVPTNKAPDYSSPKALSFINKEIKNMGWEVQKSEKGSSVLVSDSNDRITHRAFTKSTFLIMFKNLELDQRRNFLRFFQ